MSAEEEKKVWWALLGPTGDLLCTRCNGTYVMEYPLSVDATVRKLNGWTLLHADCEER